MALQRLEQYRYLHLFSVIDIPAFTTTDATTIVAHVYSDQNGAASISRRRFTMLLASSAVLYFIVRSVLESQ